MKNKIALYGDAEKLNQVEDVLSKYLNEKGILRYLLRIYKNFDRHTSRYAFFDIEQVSDDYKTLTMKSGVEIPMSRTGKKEFFKSLSLSRDTERHGRETRGRFICLL